MTEAEWLACGNPQAMMEFLCNATVLYRTRWQGWQAGRRFCITQRKFRLFACACCRRLLEQLPAESLRQAVELAEVQADGGASEEELRCLVAGIVARWDHRLAGPASSSIPLEVVHSLPANLSAGPNTTWAAAARFRAFLDYNRQVGHPSSGKDYLPEESPCWRLAEAEEARRQAELLRDIIGNPCRNITLDPAWLPWNDRCVIRMAQAIYDQGRFQDLPVLADALEEAGCDNPAVLDHCRQDLGHVRGCWVVDLVRSVD